MNEIKGDISQKRIRNESLVLRIGIHISGAGCITQIRDNSQLGQTDYDWKLNNPC